MPVFTSSDGLYITYEIAEQDSDLPPVLLHHGFAADANTNWHKTGVVDALKAAGRRVITLDARGHGESSKPHDPEFYGETKMAADVRHLVDRIGADSFDLVGYSMGAIVSLLVAVEDPRVRRLVIGGVGAAIVELGGVDSRVIGRNLIQALRTETPSLISDPNAAAFRMFADATRADRLALAAQASAVHQQRIELSDIVAPTLLLAGDADVFAARPAVLADAIPKTTLRMLSGDHLGVVRTPEFSKLIVSFLAESSTL